MPTRRVRREIEHATLRVLAAADSLEEAAPELVEAACKALGWDFAALWVLEPERRQLASFPSQLEGDLKRTTTVPIHVADRQYGEIEFFNREAVEPDEHITGGLRLMAKQIGDFVERDQMEAELEFQKALLEYQAETALDGIAVLSTDLRLLYWNQRMVEMFGITEDEIRSGDAAPIIPRLVEQTTAPGTFTDLASTVLSDPVGSHRLEAELIDGRIIDVWTTPVTSPDGHLYGRAVYARDITEQKRAAERLERQEAWTAFLAEGLRLLSESLNVEVVLDRVAQLAVPRLADWCVIHLTDVHGDPQQIAIAHVDPAKLQLARELEAKYPPDPNRMNGTHEAIRARTPLLWEDIPDQLLEENAQDEEHLQLIKQLGLRSAMIVPIIARDRALGAITLASSESARHFDEDDLQRAEEFANRVAFPIDNAKLFVQYRAMAQTLQKSFLPPDIPDIPGVDVSARYFAAGEGEAIGGDFYDAFRVDKGRWGVVLGDVSGKGLEAATVTTLARHTIRGAAMTAARPSDALAVLNTALLEQNMTDRFCTAVYAIIEPRFARVRVTVSSGGHPAPYVIRNDGAVEPIPCSGTLLGFMEGVSLRDATVDLEFGDKLFLYTDGVLDIRQKGGTFGQEGLEKLLYECSKRGTEGAAEHITHTVADLQQGRATDDIAFIILGVRSSVFNIQRGSRKSRSVESE
jgi:PAS domain S-box-containing protein